MTENKNSLAAVSLIQDIVYKSILEINELIIEEF